ncbi:MAG: hypothetical protein P4N41_14020 [Negativicutes bacterium]|nr:hypothetical protein [Negativicutes bacterium]
MYIGSTFILLLSFGIVGFLTSMFPWFRWVEPFAQVWILAGIYLFFTKMPRSFYRGKLSEKGIIRASKEEIPFAKIKKIEESVDDLLNLIVDNNSFLISLGRSDLVKLSRYDFKQWTIKNNSVTILHTQTDAPLSVKYAPINKFRGIISWRVWLFWGPVISWLFGVWGYATIVVLGLIFLFISYRYKQNVFVSLNDEGIHYTDDISEEHILFAHISRISSKRNKIRVTLNSGRTVILPRGLTLLEEFIREYSNC